MDQFRLLKGASTGLALVVIAGFISFSAVAHADTCVNGTVKRGGSGGDYYVCQGGAWLRVVPTFDPNSADGYGPNQPLPPPCTAIATVTAAIVTVATGVFRIGVPTVQLPGNNIRTLLVGCEKSRRLLTQLYAKPSRLLIPLDFLVERHHDARLRRIASFLVCRLKGGRKPF
jgi:hypothetical protein